MSRMNEEKITFGGMDILKVLIETDELHCEKYYVNEQDEISLKGLEIKLKEKYPDLHMITVLAESPLEGAVYSYGNHGSYWERTGNLAGYV